MSELYRASGLGQLLEVKRLVDAGENVNSPGGGNLTPLHVAINNKRTSVAEYIISLPQCKLQAKNVYGRTPLHVACLYHTNTDIVKLLVGRSVDVNTIDKDGDTGLHLAIHEGHTSVAEYLISLPDCDIHIRDKKGKTALDTAKKLKNTRVISLLEERLSEYKSCYKPVESIRRDQQSISAEQYKHLQSFTKCLQEELNNEHTGNQGMRQQVDDIRLALAIALEKIDELEGIKSVVPQEATAAEGSNQQHRPDLVREASRLSITAREPGEYHFTVKCQKHPESQTSLTAKLLEIAKELGSDWKTLGGFLGVSHVDIERINQTNPRETLYCGWLMLIAWRNGFKSDAMTKVQNLKTALEKHGKRNIIELL